MENKMLLEILAAKDCYYKESGERAAHLYHKFCKEDKVWKENAVKGLNRKNRVRSIEFYNNLKFGAKADESIEGLRNKTKAFIEKRMVEQEWDAPINAFHKSVKDASECVFEMKDSTKVVVFRELVRKGKVEKKNFVKARKALLAFMKENGGEKTTQFTKLFKIMQSYELELLDIAYRLDLLETLDFEDRTADLGKPLTDQEKTNIGRVLTDEAEFGRFVGKLNKTMKAVGDGLIPEESRFIPAAISEEEVCKIVEDVESSCRVLSFIDGSNKSLTRRLNAALHKYIHIVPEFTFEAITERDIEEGLVQEKLLANKGSMVLKAKFAYSTASNSEAMKIVARKCGIDRSGKLITFSKDDDDNEDRTAYTVTALGKYMLHTGAAKFVFKDRNEDDSFISMIKTKTFAMNVEEEYVRVLAKGEKVKDGEVELNFGGTSTSAEKASKVMFYAMSKEDISKMHVEIGNNGATKYPADKMKSLTARLFMLGQSGSVNAGNIKEFMDRYNKSIVFINGKFDSILEVNNDIQKKMGFSKEGPDGMFIVSDILNRWLMENITAEKVSKHQAKTTNLQGRVGWDYLKGFAISAEEEALKTFVPYLVEHFGKDNVIIEGNGAPCMIIDLNAAKMCNSVLGEFGDEMTFFMMDVAKTSTGTHMGSQIYINLCDIAGRDKIDSMITRMIAEEVKRRWNSLKNNRQFINDSAQLYQVVMAALGNKKAAKTTIVRRAFLNECKQMFSKIVEKGKIPMHGFYERATCDPMNALTNSIVQNILGFDGQYIEAYSEYASSNRVCEGVMKKYPAQGTHEYALVKFVSLEEIKRRIREQVRTAPDNLIKLKDDPTDTLAKARLRLEKACISYVKYLGSGTIMLPASALMKEMLAGMDFDFDAVSIYTDKFIVDALKEKLEGYGMNVCAIRYGATAKDEAKEKDRESRIKNVGLELDFFNDEKDDEGAEFLQTLSEIELLEKAIEGAVFKDVIGKTVSASDMAVTIDEQLIFDENGMLNKAGHIMLGALLKLAKTDENEEGGDYEPIFVKDNENYFDTVAKLAVGTETLVKIFKVDHDSVDLLMNSISNVNLHKLTLENFKKMTFELSLIARALGESAIDILKKGKSVDLGYRIEDIINPSMKKLSKSIEIKDNFNEFIEGAIYGNKDYDNELKVEFVGIAKEFIRFVEGETDVYPEVFAEDDKEKKKPIIMIIDKFGVLKVKMVRMLESTINLLVNSVFGVDGIEDDEAKSHWYKNCVNTFTDMTIRLANKLNLSEFDAKARILKGMGTAKEIINGSRDLLMDRNVEKETKNEIRNAIVTVLYNEIESVEDVSVMDIIQLTALAYSTNFSWKFLSEGARSAEAKKTGKYKKLQNKDFNALDYNNYKYTKVANEGDKNFAKKLDSVAFMMHKIFRQMAGFMYADKLYTEVLVENSFMHKRDRLSNLNDFVCIDNELYFPEDVELDGRTISKEEFEAEPFAYVSLPETISDECDSFIDDISIDLIEVEDHKGFNKSDMNSEYVMDLVYRQVAYTEYKPEIDYMLSDKEVVVLNSVKDRNGMNISTSRTMSSEYNATQMKAGFGVNVFENDGAEYVFKDDFGYRKVDYIKMNHDFVGLNIYMPNFDTPVKNKFLWGKYDIEAFLGNVDSRFLGTALYTNKEVSGVVTLALKNVLIIK